MLCAPPTPTLPELLLRPWRDDDATALIAAYRDPVLRRWTRAPVTTIAEARRFLTEARRDWDDGHRFSFAVLEPSPTGETLVAQVILKNVTEGGEDAEVGYWTAAPARGRGVAPRALTAVTEWAFARLAGLRRLDLMHQIDNPASCRVAEKAGYPFQEVLPARPPFPRDGHRHARWAEPTQECPSRSGR
ncbi:GNAT family N-acetyltransferase [Micromonospora peucetia]|uniref:GNAT family N-acetyltransferase n=1 Tax=Micromonospora peucetia TaxID=47871 RepID=UPI00225446D9|nr:GNAT family N-acetyltransferase [Micromonospora peucetia]MCX4391121.1 GNAT family N-acetyltransferase [Micromonospora peucetia]